MKVMLQPAAATTGSGISSAQMETQGLVFSNSRPADIFFDYNGITVAVDA